MNLDIAQALINARLAHADTVRMQRDSAREPSGEKNAVRSTRIALGRHLIRVGEHLAQPTA